MKIRHFVFVTLASLLLEACSKATEEVTVLSIIIKSETTLLVGAKETLKITVLPKDANDEAIWVSSDNLVASVDQEGTVTALKEGTAEIKVIVASIISNKCMVTVQAEADKNKPEHIKFADVHFLDALLKSGVDTDKDGGISITEAQTVTSMNLAGKNLTSIEEIAHFTNLKSLDCHENKLTGLYLGKNTALTQLNCSKNQLTVLNIAEKAALTSLDCSFNKLIALYVDQYTELTFLKCDRNELTDLDVSKNTALITLNCANNKITALDITANMELVELSCTMIEIKALDVTKNKALEKLYCGWNLLPSLNISENSKLIELSCEVNKFTTLDVKNQKALTYLDCWGNLLPTLDVSENTALTFLDCASNKLTTLDLTTNTALTSLDCLGNDKLTEIWVKSGMDTSNFIKGPDTNFIEK